MCRSILSNGLNRYHVLPIDNFLSLYYQKFTNKDEQSNRSRLVNEHRSKEVAVRNDNRPSIQPHRDSFSLIQFEDLAETRMRNRNRHRRRRENRRAERTRRLRRLDQIDGIHLNTEIDHALDDSGSLNRLSLIDRELRETSRRERLNAGRSGRPSAIDIAIRRDRDANRIQSANQILIPMVSRSTQYSDHSSLDVSPPSELRVNVDELMSDIHSDDFPIIAFEIDMIDLNEDDESNPSLDLVNDDLIDESRPLIRNRRSTRIPANRSANRSTNGSSNRIFGASSNTPSSRTTAERSANRSTTNRTNRATNSSAIRIAERSVNSTTSNRSNNRATNRRATLNRRGNSSTSGTSVNRMGRNRSTNTSSTPSSRRINSRNIAMKSTTDLNSRPRESISNSTPYVPPRRRDRRRTVGSRREERRTARRRRRSSINDFILDREC